MNNIKVAYKFKQICYNFNRTWTFFSSSTAATGALLNTTRTQLVKFKRGQTGKATTGIELRKKKKKLKIWATFHSYNLICKCNEPSPAQYWSQFQKTWELHRSIHAVNEYQQLSILKPCKSFREFTLCCILFL